LVDLKPAEGNCSFKETRIGLAWPIPHVSEGQGECVNFFKGVL